MWLSDLGQCEGKFWIKNWSLRIAVCNGCRAPEREIGYANMRKSNLYMTATVYLARSAKLPTGLYILPSVISSFFSLRQIISGSTGPIFTIFSPNERYLREFSRSGPLFFIPWGRCYGNRFWTKFAKWPLFNVLAFRNNKSRKPACQKPACLNLWHLDRR